MSAEIIKVLDYLCAKFGIAIDWTAENIWPQVLDFVGRYQIFAVTKHCIAVAICMIIILFGIVGIKKVYPCDDDEGKIFVMVLSVIAIIICIAILIANIFSAVEWGIVPEMRFIDMLSGYLD